jgi:hypothetical protein
MNPPSACLPLGDGGPYPETLFLGIWERNGTQKNRVWWAVFGQRSASRLMRDRHGHPALCLPCRGIPLGAGNGPTKTIGSAAGVVYMPEVKVRTDPMELRAVVFSRRSAYH